MRASVLAGLFVTSLATVSCSKSGKHLGTTSRHGRDVTTFIQANHDEPEHLDPSLIAETAGSTLARNLFEGLVGKHPEDLRIVAGAAARYDKSDDNTLFRFHLREDAKWSDGVPVTAHQFVDAWKRVLTPATGARMATNMYVIKNGALFHQGKLKALAAKATLKPLSIANNPVPLEKGAAVRVLLALPVKAHVAPINIRSAERIELKKATKDGKPATMGAMGPQPAASEGAEPQAAEIGGLGGEVKCNETPSRWYRVKAFGKEGWLPGCALEGNNDKPTEMIVAVHPQPKFSATPKKKDDDVPVIPHGVVAASALVPDSSLIGVRATSDKVLEVELARPTPYFLQLCATATYFPVRKDVIAQHGDRWTRPEHIVTNGPYTLDEHKFRYEISFKPNPHHYERDQLKLKRIVWLPINDYNTALSLYEAGSLDALGENMTVPSTQVHRLAKYGDLRRGFWIGIYWYELNVKKPPLDNPLVRRALNLAVDKKLLVENVSRGGQLPANHIVPPFSGSGYDKAHKADVEAGTDPFSNKGFTFDPDYARELIKKAGYSIEKGADGWMTKNFPEIEILYNTSEGHRVIAVAIQGMWREHLGITANLRNEEWKVMLKNLRDGNFQIGRGGWIGDYNHPHTWMDTFLSFSANNWTHWKSGKFDAMIAKAAATGDPAESIRLYRDAERVLMEEVPRIPIYFYTKLSMLKPYVKGYWSNVQNKHPMKYVWIDPDWKNNPSNTPAFPVAELADPGKF